MIGVINDIIYIIKQKLGIDGILLNQGKLLSEIYCKKKINYLDEASFKVFSQWGEDGIIQYIINNLSLDKKTFIEFGVEDFYESNCRFLLQNNNWDGFIIDGSKKNIRNVKRSKFYWKHNLRSIDRFITRDNICEILEISGFDKKNLGILSIDLDGIDWHILRELEAWQPAIYIVEYNSLFRDKPWTVPYNSKFTRGNYHYSNLFYGAGLNCFKSTLNERGYTLIGVNEQRSNAFFIKDSLLNENFNSIKLPNDLFNTKFREARDKKGKLIYKSQLEMRNKLRGFPVINTLTMKKESFF